MSEQDKIFWDDSKYSVHVWLIDGQHKHFFEICNEAFDLLENDYKNEFAILAVITELIEYAKYHFTTEEHYFEEFNYIHTNEHFEQHNMFREKANSYLKKLKAGTSRALATEIATFARNWLLIHIAKYDREYSPLFNAHGLK